MPFLPYIQIGLAVLLSILVLVQRSEAGMGAGFGGDGFTASARTKRGPELFIFRSTILVAVLFVLAAILNIVY